MNPTQGPKQICTFSLEGRPFALDVAQVQEVLRYQEFTPVPHSASFVLGLLNLRGQLVTAIDLRTLLKMPFGADTLGSMSIIVRDGARTFCLQVDDIGDVVEVTDAQFEARPDTSLSARSPLIRGVYKLHTQLVLLLDTSGINPRPKPIIQGNQHVSE